MYALMGLQGFRGLGLLLGDRKYDQVLMRSSHPCLGSLRYIDMLGMAYPETS